MISNTQLLSVDVVDVGCGSEHVVVVGGRGDIYSWGRGQAGRLGLNSEEDQVTERSDWLAGGPRVSCDWSAVVVVVVPASRGPAPH